MAYVAPQFVSSKAIVAEVKDTLRSYFETGVIDDVLFPTWITDCNRRLGTSAYSILHTVLNVTNSTAELPPEFKQVREAWMSAVIDTIHYPLPSSTYLSKDYVIDRYAEEDSRCYECGESPCCCMDDCKLVRQIMTKHSWEQVFSYKHCFPLRAGNIHCMDLCCPSSINRISTCAYTFDIKDGQFVTNFPEGIVALTYYGDASMFEEDIMVLDNQWVKEWVTAYLIFKCYDTLFHQVSDETFNQVAAKRQLYSQLNDVSYGNVETKLKLQTVQQDRDRMMRTKLRYSRFNINF